MYAGGSTHLARLRRDGFASMDAGAAPGTLTTRPFRWDGAALFVNADVAAGGELRVEVLDERGGGDSPLALERCVPVREDGTRLRVRWLGEEGALARLAGRPVRLRFRLTRGRLYAF